MVPPFLKRGDQIGIVATARKIGREEIQTAIDIFNKWGLEVVLGNNLFKEHHQFSGTDQERISDIQTMFDHESVKAIISARGGYGTIRIIDQIDFSEFRKKPKWMVGYSDITVLHSHIHQNFGIATIHATMPISFSKDAESLESLRKALFGESISYSFPEHPLNRKGSCEGILVGGNLSLLYALTGSDSDIDTKRKILFIEDLDEYLYHIDRMMINLKRSGKLAQLAGLVVGGMTDMKDNTIPFGKAAEEIILEAVSEYNYPVCFSFPAGHANKNVALMLGQKAKLNVSKTTELVF